MVLKLYGVAFSTCTRRVAVVLHEKNIPYEIVSVDIAGAAHKSPEYLSKQPFGQVPYLDDDGLIIFESRAIARYIDAKYASKGPRLSALPPATGDLAAFARFEQACSIEQANFDTFASAAVHELIVKPLLGVEGDKAIAAERLETLNAKLDAYDKILAHQKYLAGDEISLADLFHLPYGALLPQMGFTKLEDGSKPHVARWWKDITTRNAWQVVKDNAPGIKA